MNKSNYENKKDSKSRKRIDIKNFKKSFKKINNYVTNTSKDLLEKLDYLEPEQIFELVNYFDKIGGTIITLKMLSTRLISKIQKNGEEIKVDIGGKIVKFTPNMTEEEAKIRFEEISNISKKTGHPIKLLKSGNNK